MAQVFFQDLSIPEPEYNLGVRGDTHGQQIGRMIDALEPVLRDESPDYVLVYGDTNSTLAGALVGARLQLRVAHVEAGCRSFCMDAPEEQNRRVADHLSSILFTCSESGTKNLLDEGIGVSSDPLKRNVFCTGDLMYDCFKKYIPLAERRSANLLLHYGVSSGAFYLMTVHRADNTDNPTQLLRILETADRLDALTLFPVHPRTRKRLEAIDSVRLRNVRMIAPLGYLDFVAIAKHACKVLTDSGGVQKEAFFLGVPCVTLRQETEWPETVTAGANLVVGTDPEHILAGVRATQAFSNHSDIFGHGDAATRILGSLLGEDIPVTRRFNATTNQVRTYAD